MSQPKFFFFFVTKTVDKFKSEDKVQFQMRDKLKGMIWLHRCSMPDVKFFAAFFFFFLIKDDWFPSCDLWMQLQTFLSSEWGVHNGWKCSLYKVSWLSTVSIIANQGLSHTVCVVANCCEFYACLVPYLTCREICSCGFFCYLSCLVLYLTFRGICSCEFLLLCITVMW